MQINKEGWKPVKFGELCSNVNSSVRDPLDNGIDRYVGLEHIEPGSLHIKSWGNVADGTTFTKGFKPGHVLFGKRRAYQKKAAIANFAGLCSGDILVLEANENLIDPKLLPFLVSSERVFDYAVQTSAGSLSPRTKFQDLAKLEFLLPPKDEQTRLVELLWAADEVVERYKDSLRIFELFCTQYFEKVVKEGLQTGVESINSPIGRIPKHWQYRLLKEVLMIRDGTHFTPKYVDEGIPFLRVTDIQDNQINREKLKYVTREEHDVLTKRIKPQKNDILYSKNGTIGVSKIVDWDWEFSIFVSIAILRIKDANVLLPDFLKLILDSNHIAKEIRRRAKQQTVTNLHLEEIKEFRIVIPPIAEQREILSRTNNLRDSARDITETLRCVKDIRNQVINQIFS